MFNLDDNRDWNLAAARARIQTSEEWEEDFKEYLYRPFDVRSLYYSEDLIDWPRIEVMQHLLRPNLALMAMRQVVVPDDIYSHFGVSRLPVDNRAFFSTRGILNVFPLYLYPSRQEIASGLYGSDERRPNLNPKCIQAFSVKLGLAFLDDGKGDLETAFGPDDIFNYAYAVFHSPTYRTRYAGFLKTDFPRLPLTSDRKLFKSIAGKGAELVTLHLMESPALNRLITKYPVSGSNVVEKVAYVEPERRVYINKTQHFEGVDPEVWNFHIGGYQVCQKWLKDRKDRTLTYDDLTHYQRVVVALKETIRLMAETDSLIPSWPLE